MTIVTQGRECLFGEIVEGEMRLNDWGKTTEECWVAIPHHFPHVQIDAYTIMPNHVHGIIVITRDVGETSHVGARCNVPLRTE